MSRARANLGVALAARFEATGVRADLDTRLKVLSRLRGNRILLPSPEAAATYPYTDSDRAAIATLSGSVLVDSSDDRDQAPAGCP